ncbi:MAG: TonB-dependent receptor [Candidatus Manganitrophaceae bacterium]|nr:MAG: TonB-dependent receptor [Candidatus Manganitrophaceae bacterium]
MKRKAILVVLLCVFLGEAPLFAGEMQSTEEGLPVAGGGGGKAGIDEEEMLFFEQEAQLSLATKRLQTVREAPAVATVITERQIRNMGARDLADILRQVPGFGVTVNNFGKTEIEIRGTKTPHNARVLVLIDGIRANDNFTTGPGWPILHMSVDNIKQVEIIRGPGSALYGSNAFIGVINVVTKQGEEIDGVIVSGGRGTFDTGRYNVQAGKRFGDLDVAFFIDYATTDGPKLRVEQDAIGRSGTTDYFVNTLDTGFKVAYKDLSLNTRLIRVERGPYLGFSDALNDETELDFSHYLSELAYQRRLTDNVKLTAKGYVTGSVMNMNLELLPEGTGPYADGWVSALSDKEQNRGVELQLDFRWADTHQLTAGAMVEQRQLYDPKHLSNVNPLTGAPLGSVQDISDFANWILSKNRDVWAVYLQDDWRVTNYLNLVLGVRHDRYSDFGGTTNPRAAAVVQFAQTWDVKLMYGRAFSSPSFGELYLVNNPTIIANPELEPDFIQTYEASLGYWKGGAQGRISYFQTDIDNEVVPVVQPSGASKNFNRGGTAVHGIEVEMRKQIFRLGTEVYGNYTYQKAENTVTDQRLADIAAHKGNVGVDLSLFKHLNVNANLFMSGKKPRAPGDPRKDAPGYALLDLTVIAREFNKGLELRGSVHNLLDKEYADPLPPTVPGDLPREGRHVMVEALYRF